MPLPLPPTIYDFDEGAEPIEIVAPHKISIDVRDDQIWLSAKACFSRKGFVHSCVAFVVSGIVINTLSTYMDYLVRLGGAGKSYVGIVGGSFQLIIMLSSLLVGRYADETRRYYTVAICLLVMGAFALAESCVRLDEDDGPQLRLTLLAVAALVGPLQPIATELGVDVAYPLSENTVLVIQQLFSNLLSAVFIQFFDFCKDIGRHKIKEEEGDFYRQYRPEYTFSFYLLIVLHACGTVFL
jgi:MFS family permease